MLFIEIHIYLASLHLAWTTTYAWSRWSRFVISNFLLLPSVFAVFSRLDSFYTTSTQRILYVSRLFLVSLVLWIDKPWGNTLSEKLHDPVRLRYINWCAKERQQLTAWLSYPWAPGCGLFPRGERMRPRWRGGPRSSGVACVEPRSLHRAVSGSADTVSWFQIALHWLWLGLPCQWLVDYCWRSLAPQFIYRKRTGSCSFSLRVFPQGLSIRGLTKNYLRFSI